MSVNPQPISGAHASLARVPHASQQSPPVTYSIHRSAGDSKGERQEEGGERGEDMEEVGGV